MLLSELDFRETPGLVYCGLEHEYRERARFTSARFGACEAFRTSTPEPVYTILVGLNYAAVTDRTEPLAHWHDLDPLTAQAVLFDLTGEQKPDESVTAPAGEVSQAAQPAG